MTNFEIEIDALTEQEVAEAEAIMSIENMTDEQLYDEYKKIVDGPACQYEAAIIAAWNALMSEWNDDVPMDEEAEDFYDSLHGEPDSDIWAWYSE